MNRLINLAGILTASLLITFFSCTSHRAKIDNSFKKYFDDNNVDGCFTMLNNSTGEVTVYNMAMDTCKYSPASTFKIVNSLIGLQTGKILDDSMVIKWDSVKRPIEAWNKDMNMIEAFKVNAVPYYQVVARRIGRDTMKRWIDSLRYGNMNVDGPIDSFWLNNKLKISPDEQLGLMKRLYFDQLPFRKSVQQSVRDVMLMEDSTTYKLSYKTGLGGDEKGNDIAWMTGWIQENMHVYFFVTFIKAKNMGTDLVTARMNISRSILKQLGFFSGKM